MSVRRPEPVHLRPAAELAERVLLPGDPHRALAVAQVLLERPPAMFNHARGLWGYTGVAPDGRPLTIQSTGMGGASAAIVVEELIGLGARRLVRMGTCGALGDAAAPGELLAVESVVAVDGAALALGPEPPLQPAADLLARLVEAGARPVPVASSDLFYERGRERELRWSRLGAAAVEMETGALLAVAAHHGVSAASVLGVAGVAGAGGRLAREELEQLGLRVGKAAFAALRTR